MNRSLRSLTAVAGLALAAASGATLVQPSASAAAVTPHQARPADGFVDSIGVVTHLTYLNTAYGNHDLVVQRLQQLGVRHIRDGWGTGSPYADTLVRGRLHDLGIGITFVVDPRTGTTPAAAASMLGSRLMPAVDAVEPLNEWDTQGDGWASYARNWTIQLSQAVRGNSALRGVPVLAPSMADTNEPTRYQAVGNLGSYVDYGTTHDYPGYQYQMTDEIMRTAKQNSGVIAPGKPLVATETGFSSSSHGSPYTVLPAAQVPNALDRLFLEHYANGYARTFAYELMDQFPNDLYESNYGLVRNDGTPKPQFTALQSMISLLSDKGAAFTPGSLGYDLAGTGPQTRQLLLQKRDGSYWLAVWEQQKEFDGKNVLTSPKRQVTLSLGGAAGVTVYRPTLGTAAQSSSSGTSTVSFESSTEPTLLRIGGGSTPTTSTPTTSTPTTSTPPVSTPAATTPAASTPTPTPTATVQRTWVSDATSWKAVSNGWGPVERDRSVGEAGAQDGRQITVGGSAYSMGLGVHAPSEITVPTGGAKTFTTVVGVDDEVGAHGSVRFQLFNGSTLLADSGLVRGTDGGKVLTASLAGVSTLRLVVSTGGDSKDYDHADWAGAQLLK
ncbi:NPCBM/NEW2 domain-containing protein [Motilibacter rhizosphaerae]|uniref:NPCBM/NEW2 domain-containing protein n=1 Tax=Motilibacter rhizosphaerae TaxID=598652 RepID=A0A4Q7NUY2_9ACTN|nr:NPCBM/NEW2 domain-containing protein [Motilibacter rhizosphaerae]RZS90987.1 NPCBM/NEW2 domain-containing protein [Motilibacter rhizosphaerae]